ncbi:MAG: peptide deformylase [Clostridiales bacterium]|nr:peptide deformylase [Clostridiales bacterium]
MAILTLRTEGDPCLSKKCKPVVAYDAKLARLLDDMIDTMRDRDGVGLAAPQVGILRRAFVMDAGDGLVEMVNPEIIVADGLQRGEEGCLSFPNRGQGYVERAEHVVVEASDRHGDRYRHEGSGLFARAVLHEVDHLNGEVFLRLITEPPEDYIKEKEERERENKRKQSATGRRARGDTE